MERVKDISSEPGEQNFEFFAAVTVAAHPHLIRVRRSLAPPSNELLLRPRRNAPDGQENSVKKRMRIRRAAGNVNVHWNHLIHSAKACVILAEDAAATAASAHGDDKSRRWHRIVGFAQGQLHIARDRTGDQKHIRVPRRSNEVNAEALDVVNRTVQTDDFNFASITGTGIDFTDMQGTPQHFVDADR